MSDHESNPGDTSFVVKAASFAVCGAITLGVLSLVSGRQKRARQTESLVPSVSKLRDLREFATTDVILASVRHLKHDDYRGAWIVKGDAIVSVDMGQAEFDRVEDEPKTIVLRLPLPRVIHARIDHETTQEYDFKKRGWNFFPEDQGEVRDKAMRDAEREIETLAADTRHIERAKSNTEIFIRKMFQLAGSNAQIKWVGPSRPESVDDKNASDEASGSVE